MNTQFRKGVLEICVLTLISTKVIVVNEGTIYPILRRLTKEGYFETYILESNEGPARKYYKITPEGIENLNRLKSEWNEFVYAVNTFLND